MPPAERRTRHETAPLSGKVLIFDRFLSFGVQLVQDHATWRVQRPWSLARMRESAGSLLSQIDRNVSSMFPIPEQAPAASSARKGAAGIQDDMTHRILGKHRRFLEESTDEQH